jgi:preprotein translocase subunit SecG
MVMIEIQAVVVVVVVVVVVLHPSTGGRFRHSLFQDTFGRRLFDLIPVDKQQQ